MPFETEAKQYTDPEKMAAAYLVKYYRNQKIVGMTPSQYQDAVINSDGYFRFRG